MLLGVTLVSFLLAHVVPADPVAAMLGEQAGSDPQVVAAFKHRWGLDRPLIEQYGIYVWRLVHGDMGTSFTTRQPVFLDIRQHLPATIELAASATLLSVIIGIPIGILSAVRRNTGIDQAVRVVSVLGVSMPVFWVGLVAIVIFYSWLGWAPSPGELSAELSPPPFVTGSVIVDAALARQWPVLLNALRHLLLPAAVLSFYGVGLLTRMVRGSMIDILGEDYMRTARAKGLPTLLVLLRHALRNGLIPIVTVIGLNLGNLLSGSVVVETVFAWPGLGRYAFQTAMSIDFAAIMGFAMVVTVVYLLMNLLVDTAYIVIDPRLRFD